MSLFTKQFMRRDAPQKLPSQYEGPGMSNGLQHAPQHAPQQQAEGEAGMPGTHTSLLSPENFDVCEGPRTRHPKPPAKQSPQAVSKVLKGPLARFLKPLPLPLASGGEDDKLLSASDRSKQSKLEPLRHHNNNIHDHHTTRVPLAKLPSVGPPGQSRPVGQGNGSSKRSSNALNLNLLPRGHAGQSVQEDGSEEQDVKRHKHAHGSGSDGGSSGSSGSSSSSSDASGSSGADSDQDFVCEEEEESGHPHARALKPRAQPQRRGVTTAGAVRPAAVDGLKSKTTEGLAQGPGDRGRKEGGAAQAKVVYLHAMPRHATPCYTLWKDGM